MMSNSFHFGVKMKCEYNIIVRVTAFTVLTIGQAQLFIKPSSTIN